MLILSCLAEFRLFTGKAQIGTFLYTWLGPSWDTLLIIPAQSIANLEQKYCFFGKCLEPSGQGVTGELGTGKWNI